MASKTISRILNRSMGNFYSNSFYENSMEENSSTAFYFDQPDQNSEHIYATKAMEADLTENEYPKKREKETFSEPRRVSEHFEEEKKFLGTIVEINEVEGTFSASLSCPDDNITRRVLFAIDNLAEELKPLVEIGRRLIYIYGKQIRNGTVTNVSSIYFRQNAKWTKREIEAIEREALELYNLLNGSSAG